MKGFCPLSSGSKGNAIYLGTGSTKILIDAGISSRALKNRLGQINVDLSDIDAVLVTHDHGDHIQGLKILGLRYGIPVFANTETAKGIAQTFQTCPKFKIFTTGETFEYGDLEIHPFSVMHDTMDPVAFTIKMGSLKLGFCTDLGFSTPLVKHCLQECDYLYLEANHQPSMVHASSRSYVYKRRVLSRQGHLSNLDCGQLLSEVWHPKLKHVHLAHLSSECNTPETALSVVSQILQDNKKHVAMSIAFQDKIGKALYF